MGANIQGWREEMRERQGHAITDRPGKIAVTGYDTAVEAGRQLTSLVCNDYGLSARL